MSEKDYSKLTVNILKEELKRRSLDQAGKKADLVSRLETDDLNNSMKMNISHTNEDTNNTEELDEPSEELPLKETDKDGLLGNKDCESQVSEENDDKNPLAINKDLEEIETNSSKNDIQQQEHASEKISPLLDEKNETSTEQLTSQSVNDSNVEEHSNEKFSKNVEEIEYSIEKNYKNIEEIEQSTESNSARVEEIESLTEKNSTNVKEIEASSELLHEEEHNGFVETKEPQKSNQSESLEIKKENKINTEDDVRVANEYCIEMKRDKDEFQLKWRGKKFAVPFIGEIILDLAKEISNRSFQVKQIELKDIKSSCFDNMISESLKFLIDFQSNILDSSNTGFAKFIFKNNEECEKHKESVKNYNENIIIEPVKFEDQLVHQFLNKDLSFYKGTIVDRLLYVGNLPFDVTQSTVGDLFPDALRLIFPPLKEIDQSINTARYIYLEYGSANDVINAADKYKDVLLNGDKLFVIKALCVKKERFGLLTDTLRMILLDKVRKLKKIQRTPYGKSRQELQEVEKGITLNMDKLSTDSRHRKSWGMELGALDEERIDREEPDKPDSGSQRGGGLRMGRGTSRGSYDARRPNNSNISHQQRYSNFGNYNNYNNNAVRPGWSQSYYGTSGFMNQSFMNQGYSQGYGAQHGSFYANKRKGSDNYGGDWKRGRTF